MLSNIITNLICTQFTIPNNKALKATFELELEDGESGSRCVELLVCNRNENRKVLFKDVYNVVFEGKPFANEYWYKMHEKRWEDSVESFFSFMFYNRLYSPDPFKPLFSIVEIPEEVLSILNKEQNETSQCI